MSKCDGIFIILRYFSNKIKLEFHLAGNAESSDTLLFHPFIAHAVVPNNIILNF